MNEATELDAMAAQMPNDLDDLDNLFEFGDIDLNNIPDTDGFDGQPLQQQQQQHPHHHSHPGTHPNTPFQDMSPAPPMPATSAHDFGGMDQFGMSPNMAQTQQQQQFIDAHAQTTMPFTSEPMYQPSMQQMYHSQQQQFQMHPHQGYPHNNQVVPPTPNSFEMHGVPGRYLERHQQLDAQQQAILAQRYALRKEEIAFTPMVSPAGTPQYHMLPEFTTPGAYFSPLTSPMLHAQSQHHQQQLQMHLQQQQGYITNPSTAPSSNANSPVDPTMDVDMASGSMQGSTGPQPRKSGRRKVATAKGATTGGSKVNTSTSQRAQKRKSSAQTQGQQASAAEDLSLRAVQTQPVPSTLQMPSQFDSSEAESISPEPLSESVMGPPPRPSTSQSPAMAGQQRQHANAVAAAATPKSLLTMRTAHQTVSGGSGDTTAGSEDLGGLDDLALPEAANTRPMRPTHAQINTNIPPSIDGEDDTPRMSARKTPKFGPLSTPSSARPGSAVQSPTVASPMSASTPSAILRDKKDAKGGRGSKKRGSMSTNGSKMVSPALVPKISPSIKPLLPEGSKSTSYHLFRAAQLTFQQLLSHQQHKPCSLPPNPITRISSRATVCQVSTTPTPYPPD